LPARSRRRPRRTKREVRVVAARYKARVESENREKLADFAQRLEMEEKAKLAAKEVEDERSRYR